MIDASTKRVVNVIVADPEHDNPWPGHVLVALDEGSVIDARYGWNEDKGFYPVDPDLIEEFRQIDAEKQHIEALKPYLLED